MWDSGLRGGPTLMLGAVNWAARVPVSPPFVFGCKRWQQKQHHCRLLLSARQRAVKCVPYFPPHVTVPTVTARRNGNSSSAQICAVCRLAVTQLLSLTCTGPVSSCNSVWASARRWELELVPQPLPLISNTPAASRSPQPSAQVPSQLSSEAYAEACFPIPFLTI